MKKLKLLVLGAALLTIPTFANEVKTNQMTSAADRSISKQMLSASEAKAQAQALGFAFNNKTDLKNKYGSRLRESNDYITSEMFETNVRSSYSKFTGYTYRTNDDIAETKINISQFKSENICVSSTVGVYEKVSYGVDVSVAAEIGVSTSVSHTVSVNQTFTLSGKDPGLYGLMIRFYTCNKLYLRFSGNVLQGGYLVSNNPSTTHQYYFVKRGV